MDDTMQLTTPVETAIPVDAMEGAEGEVDRGQVVLNAATVLFNKAPDWTLFFREILGMDGIVRRMYASDAELDAFEKTAEYHELQHMLKILRERKDDSAGEDEPTRVITVRLPKSVHEYLKAEAHDRHTSMNKLCISKLVQIIDMKLVPAN